MKKRIEQYVLEEQIGSGSYGAVFRGYDERRVGGEQVAIKVIGLQQVEQNQKIYEFIFQEVLY
jgi:serine/threonine protein kinase